MIHRLQARHGFALTPAARLRKLPLGTAGLWIAQLKAGVDPTLPPAEPTGEGTSMVFE